MKRNFPWLALLFAIIVGGVNSGSLSAQEGQTTRLKVNAAEIEIAGRVQTQINTTSAESEPAMEMLLRRVRLEARVRVNELVSGRVQPDFAGDRVSLKDAYLRLDFAPQLQMIAGKAHRPFSLIEQVSSVRVLPVERGVRLRGVSAQDQYAIVSGLAYSDRDVGVQLLGSFADLPFRPGYQAGFFAGPLQRQVGNENSYQLAARATIQPVERLRLGAAVSRRDFARPAPDRPSGWHLDQGSAYSLDLQYGSFAPGLHLIGEIAFGDFDPFAGDSFQGAQGWLAYRTAPQGRVSAIEPIFRASYGSVHRGDPLVPDPGGLLLTPGINLYLGGLNRVMLNYDLWDPLETGRREGGWKMQFQLVF
ncbi:hypothetical protein BH23GEM6_BH23GEM6_12170 [soil metagenome]